MGNFVLYIMLFDFFLWVRVEVGGHRCVFVCSYTYVQPIQKDTVCSHATYVVTLQTDLKVCG